MAFIRSDADERVYRLQHDIKNSLHVISIGLELLRAARHDDSRFDEVFANLERERRTVAKLLDELLAALDPEKGPE